MTPWAAIDYRDFWDFPHVFLATDGGRTYLFDCHFDEDQEDYFREFAVYLMPPLGPEERTGSWASLARHAVAKLGHVATNQVRFDPTRRQFVDLSILETLTNRTARAPG